MAMPIMHSLNKYLLSAFYVPGTYISSYEHSSK